MSILFKVLMFYGGFLSFYLNIYAEYGFFILRELFDRKLIPYKTYCNFSYIKNLKVFIIYIHIIFSLLFFNDKEYG